jgi:hypothetical protein
LAWNSNRNGAASQRFTATFTDGTTYTMAADNTGVNASISMPNDILLEFKPDGSIAEKNLARLSSISPESTLMSVKLYELCRIITKTVSLILISESVRAMQY